MTKKKILPITLGMMLLGVGSSAARVHESYVPAPRHEHPEEIQAPRGEHPEEIQAPRGVPTRS